MFSQLWDYVRMSLKRESCRFSRMRTHENELKMLKIEFSRAWDLARMSSNFGKLRFLIHEIVWEWAETAKIGVFSRENLWEWAQNTENWAFSRVRSCENELRTQEITFSHLWDYVRMSLKRENWRFFKRENLWEWAENARNWLFSRVRCRENECCVEKIPIFSQCYPPPN